MFTETTLLKISENSKKMWQNPEYRNKVSNGIKRRYNLDPTWKEKISADHKGKKHSYEWNEKIGISNKKRYSDPQLRKKISEISKRLWEKNEFREKNRLGKEKALKDIGYHIKLSESNKRRHENPTYHQKIVDLLTNRNKSTEFRKKISESLTKIHNTEDAKIKVSMRRQGLTTKEEWETNGGFATKQKYCERWTPDLKRRIRLLWGNCCAKCGKTMLDEGQNLACHHVYWQKSSCCIKDDDNHNCYFKIGSERYYYKGDPNKFVPLCSSCHQSMGGKIGKKSKIELIKEMENLINFKFEDGLSYYTKEEYNEISKYYTYDYLKTLKRWNVNQGQSTSVSSNI